MKTYLSIISLGLAFAASQSAFAADKGTVIPRDKLPASMTAKVAKEAKFPGVPSCAKGRIIVDKWPTSVEQADHPCKDAQDLYVCVAFGKISVKCENPAAK
jgi:hypothetical protein